MKLSPRSNPSEDPKVEQARLIARANRIVIIAALSAAAAGTLQYGLKSDDQSPEKTGSVSLKTAANRKVRKVNETAIKKYEVSKTEQNNDEVVARLKHGGHFFSMKELPEMAEESPKVRGRVYMRFPEKIPKAPRVVLFFHGGGGQVFTQTSNMNVMEAAKEMQGAGEPIVLIMPQDGWGNRHPKTGYFEDEGYITVPGNWEDFENPHTLANLIGFAETVSGAEAEDITLASFSSGDLGVMKTLRSLEQAKDQSPEMEDLYKRIDKVAYFDSLSGLGRAPVARWLGSDEANSISSCFVSKEGGQVSPAQYGTQLLGREIRGQGIEEGRLLAQPMMPGEGHGVYKGYFRRYTTR